MALAAFALAAWQSAGTRQRLGETQQEVACRLAEAEASGSADRGRSNWPRSRSPPPAGQGRGAGGRQAEFRARPRPPGPLPGSWPRLPRRRLAREIEQAITLAAQNLQLTGNVAAAVLALQTADARLTRLDRPQFMPLRKAVGRDLDRLRALPSSISPG